MGFPEVRLRRLRQHPKLRAMLSETHLSVNDLVMPLFVHHEADRCHPIASMPGQMQWGLNRIADEARAIFELGIPAIILFGIPAEKDATGSAALSEKGVVQTAIRLIKKAVPGLLVMADCCFCEYTDHGHCGIVHDGVVDNDATLTLLGEQAVSLATAGADVIAPSGMMDGMVLAIRDALDDAGFSHIPILSYAVKYASVFYGPFRDAAEGAPQFGDRCGYQMDPANVREALREADMDVQEGADLLMIKPAHTYLDVITKVRDVYSEIPLGGYHVSGEYAMIKAAAEKGWLDEQRAVMEVTLSIKRAGADFIVTYFAKQIAAWLS